MSACPRCDGLGVVCAACGEVYDDCECGAEDERPMVCPVCDAGDDTAEWFPPEDAVIDDPDLWDCWNERGSD